MNNSSDIAAHYGVAIAARCVSIVSRFFPRRQFRLAGRHHRKPFAMGIMRGFHPAPPGLMPTGDPRIHKCQVVYMDSINSRIAEELGVRPQQVEAAVGLLDEGSTVPFIARYRKEVTGSLDDTQLRHLEERLRYLRELDERRASILSSIEEQGKLTPELAREIKLADTKTRL
jgi:uncharacterized protein